jgi:hypothetical protein
MVKEQATCLTPLYEHDDDDDETTLSFKIFFALFRQAIAVYKCCLYGCNVAKSMHC